MDPLAPPGHDWTDRLRIFTTDLAQIRGADPAQIRGTDPAQIRGTDLAQIRGCSVFLICTRSVVSSPGSVNMEAAGRLSCRPGMFPCPLNW